MRLGYAVIEIGSSISEHKIVATTYGGLPWRVTLPIGVVDVDKPLQVVPNEENPKYQLLEMHLVNEPPVGNSNITDEEMVVSEDATVLIHREYETLPDPVPDTMSKLALRNVLSDMGRWGEFKDYLRDNPNVAEVWELASDVNRRHELVPVVKTKFDLTDEQVDHIFREGNRLTSS